MAETGARQDPFVAFRFVVEINGRDVGGFSECSGLALETEIQEYMEGGLNTHVLKFPTRTKQVPLVLKRGIVDKSLWDWYFDLARGKFEERGGAVRVLDHQGEKDVMEFRFFAAFPAKWTGPDLSAAQGSIAVETLELCHQGLERKR